VYWDTHKLILPTNNTIVSPRTFPYVVATLLMVASIGVALEVLRGRAGVPEGTEIDTPFQRADFRTMLIIVFAIGLHVFLLERTGYIISAAISFWGVAYAFGAKKIVKIGIISLSLLLSFTLASPTFLISNFLSGLLKSGSQRWVRNV